MARRKAEESLFEGPTKKRRIEFSDSPAITVDLLDEKSVESFVTRFYPLVARNLSKERNGSVRTTAELIRLPGQDSWHHNYIIVRLKEISSATDLLVRRNTVYYVAWRSWTEEGKSPWVFLQLESHDHLEISRGGLSFPYNPGQLYIKCLDDDLVFSAAKEREIREIVKSAESPEDLIFPEFIQCPLGTSYESIARFSIDKFDPVNVSVHEVEENMLSCPLGLDSIKDAVRGLSLTKNSAGKWSLPEKKVLSKSTYSIILFVPEGSRFPEIRSHFLAHSSNVVPLSNAEKILLFCWRKASHALKLFYMDGADELSLLCKRKSGKTLTLDTNELLQKVSLIQNFNGREVINWTTRFRECTFLPKKTLCNYGGSGNLRTGYQGRRHYVLTREPRRMISVGESKVSSDSVFTVLSYNILADWKAIHDRFSYCPPEALSWMYRREQVLEEIEGYDADIICLQEVQEEHFYDFFKPKLARLGYEAHYAEKLQKITDTCDGCATFFRKNRFSFSQDFKEKSRIIRKLKDATAQILILETKIGNQGVKNLGKRQRIVLANTQLISFQANVETNFIQLFTFLKRLEEVAASLPLVVCGDLGTTPGSMAHEFLTTGAVDELRHKLHLKSAYSSFAKARHRMMNATWDEPLYTSCTKDFSGAVDYIFYSAFSLKVESLLELLDVDAVIPSLRWPSNHIALVAKFSFNP